MSEYNVAQIFDTSVAWGKKQQDEWENNNSDKNGDAYRLIRINFDRYLLVGSPGIPFEGD